MSIFEILALVSWTNYKTGTSFWFGGQLLHFVARNWPWPSGWNRTVEVQAAVVPRMPFFPGSLPGMRKTLRDKEERLKTAASCGEYLIHVINWSCDPFKGQCPKNQLSQEGSYCNMTVTSPPCFSLGQEKILTLHAEETKYLHHFPLQSFASLCLNLGHYGFT